MRMITVAALLTALISSCNGSNWKTIEGNGIDNRPKSIGNAIYFENENRGLIGGYNLIKDPNANNDFGLSMKPLLFSTNDGGKNWSKIQFETALNGGIRAVFLKGDTIVCKIDSSIFLSSDGGKRLRLISGSIEQKIFIKKHFNANRFDIKDRKFIYKERRYYVKETYDNGFAKLNICKSGETLTDYYFVSRDNGKTWTFLRKDFSDNLAKFLLEDKFLYKYHYPFGLLRLSIK